MLQLRKKKVKNENISRKNAEKIRKKEAARQKAIEIFDSIPDALEKAAKRAKNHSKNLKITVKIPIVNEEGFSIMCNEGSLSEEDKAVLAVVRAKLKKVSIPEVDSLTIGYTTKYDSFVDGSGDSSGPGPRKHYYLKAEVILPK